MKLIPTSTENPHKIYDTLLKYGSSPALVWHGENERIELSGKVCANHLAKIANYLADECEISYDSTVIIDLPTHWKSLLWALGSYLCGAQVVYYTPTNNPTPAQYAQQLNYQDLVLTNRPDFWHSLAIANTTNMAVLNLASLALAWSDSLPTYFSDATAEALAAPDALLIANPSDSAPTFFTQYEQNFTHTLQHYSALSFAYSAPKALNNTLQSSANHNINSVCLTLTPLPSHRSALLLNPELSTSVFALGKTLQRSEYLVLIQQTAANCLATALTIHYHKLCTTPSSNTEPSSLSIFLTDLLANISATNTSVPLADSQLLEAVNKIATIEKSWLFPHLTLTPVSSY